MVQAIINIDEHSNRILNVIKARYGLKDKSEAINIMAQKYEESVMEPELKPEYVEKLTKIKKQNGIKFKSVDALRKHIENARV